MVRILVGSRRPWLSDALATWSYDTNVFDQPLSVDTLVSAAVKVVLPWSTCPIVPTLQCGLFRSNFSLPISALLMQLGRHAARSIAGSRVLGLYFFRDVARHFRIVGELHRVRRTPLAHGPQLTDVAEHVGQRHVGAHHGGVAAHLLIADLAAAAVDIADDVADEVARRHHLDIHHRLE